MPELVTDPEVLADRSGFCSRRVDWRFVGGRAILLVLGDAEEQKLVRELAIANIEQLCDAYMVCTSNFSKNPSRDDVQWSVL